MSIIRTFHNKENPYVCLNKKALWDENLSLKAIGLWSRCLSRPTNWIFSLAEMVKHTREGMCSLKKCINELIREGYCFRFQERRKDSTFGHVQYIFLEEKATPEEIEELKKCLPLVDFPLAGNQPLLSNEREISKEREREGAPPPPSAAPPPLHSSKKKLSEEPEEKAERVWITPSQHESLLKKAGGSEELVRAWYERLSIWKVDRGHDPKTRNYAAILKWVVEAVEKDRQTKNFKTNSTEKNAEWIKSVAEKLKDHPVSIGYNYVEFNFGQRCEHIPFSSHGFKDIVMNHAGKMNIRL